MRLDDSLFFLFLPMVIYAFLGIVIARSKGGRKEQGKERSNEEAKH